MRRATLLNWAFVGIWIEPSLPNTSILSVWPENHFGVEYLEKMVKIWTISVHFDNLESPCNWQHCSVRLLGEIWIESSPPYTHSWWLWPRPATHFIKVYANKYQFSVYIFFISFSDISLQSGSQVEPIALNVGKTWLNSYPHKSPIEQCCPSHRLQKWSKWTEVSLIFTIFLGYTTPKCLQSRTNELKRLGD